LFNQRTWRRIGLASLAVCGAMAWGGTRSGVTHLGPLALLAYWGVFLAALLVALYMALIDLRYIRLQYSLGEKELFEETLGSEELRTALREPHGTAPRGDGARHDD
jgi:hypothetical protein